MDFRQLEAFIKVVELESFSKAAKELHVSQPSVSTYINSLEKELGSVLLNRSTKSLSTTLAGERFLGKAREIVSLKQQSIEMMKNLSGDISGEIRILASSVPALYILPQVLTDFNRVFPDITFTVKQADTLDVVQGLAANKADIGFAGSVLDSNSCEFIEYSDEKLVFIASSNSPFSENKKYSLEDILYKNSFISRESGSGTRIQYEKYFIENGIDPDKIKICACMDNTQSIINAVISGLGISIVSEAAFLQNLQQSRLKQINTTGKLPQRKIYVVLNKNIIRSHLLTLFAEYITVDYPM